MLQSKNDLRGKWLRIVIPINEKAFVSSINSVIVQDFGKYPGSRRVVETANRFHFYAAFMLQNC